MLSHAVANMSMEYVVKSCRMGEEAEAYGRLQQHFCGLIYYIISFNHERYLSVSVILYPISQTLFSLITCK